MRNVLVATFVSFLVLDRLSWRSWWWCWSSWRRASVVEPPHVLRWWRTANASRRSLVCKNLFLAVCQPTTIVPMITTGFRVASFRRSPGHRRRGLLMFLGSPLDRKASPSFDTEGFLVGFLWRDHREAGDRVRLLWRLVFCYTFGGSSLVLNSLLLSPRSRLVGISLVITRPSVFSLLRFGRTRRRRRGTRRRGRRCWSLSRKLWL